MPWFDRHTSCLHAHTSHCHDAKEGARENEDKEEKMEEKPDVKEWLEPTYKSRSCLQF